MPRTPDACSRASRPLETTKLQHRPTGVPPIFLTGETTSMHGLQLYSGLPHQWLCEESQKHQVLVVHMSDDLTWCVCDVLKKAQQRLRRLKTASPPPPILTTFHRGTGESILTRCITVCFGNCTRTQCVCSSTIRMVGKKSHPHNRLPLTDAGLKNTEITIH